MGFTDVVSDKFAAGSRKKDAAGNFPKTDNIEPPSMLQTTPENQEAKATNIRPKDEDAYSEFPFPPRKTLSLDDICQNCNLALLYVEPQSFEKAFEAEPW